jgi:hypothetical protein
MLSSQQMTEPTGLYADVCWRMLADVCVDTQAGLSADDWAYWLGKDRKRVRLLLNKP